MAGEKARKPTIHDVLDLINDYRIGGLEQVLIGLDVVSAKNARAEEILYARRNAKTDLKERYGEVLSEAEIAELADRIEEEIRKRRPDV
jgi:histidinol phosphatase-like enzyme